MKLNILGTEYEVVVSTEDKEPLLTDCDGCCDTSTKKLYIKDCSRDRNDTNALRDLDAYMHKVARHEMTHAFLHESGLSICSDWAMTEELVDWIAIQLPKMAKLAAELDAVRLMTEE